MADGKRGAPSLTELREKIERLERENLELTSEKEAQAEAIGQLEQSAKKPRDDPASSHEPNLRTDVYMPSKGAMYPFRIKCLTKQIGDKVIDLPDKEVDAKDEVDAIRWYCATTPHPFNPSKGLDVSSFRFRVTILTDERLNKVKKKQAEALQRRREEAGLFVPAEAAHG
jgi:hypothetical protein